MSFGRLLNDKSHYRFLLELPFLMLIFVVLCKATSKNYLIFHTFSLISKVVSFIHSLLNLYHNNIHIISMVLLMRTYATLCGHHISPVPLAINSSIAPLVLWFAGKHPSDVMVSKSPYVNIHIWSLPFIIDVALPILISWSCMDLYLGPHHSYGYDCVQNFKIHKSLN